MYDDGTEVRSSLLYFGDRLVNERTEFARQGPARPQGHRDRRQRGFVGDTKALADGRQQDGQRLYVVLGDRPVLDASPLDQGQGPRREHVLQLSAAGGWRGGRAGPCDRARPR
jgi:hypothetical protein